MKKSLALALALIMVMGCMGFAAAEGRTVTDMTGSSDIQSTYKITESTEANKASVQLTFFADDSAWQTGSSNQYISVQAKLAAPKAEARFVQLLRSDGEKIGDGPSPLKEEGNTYYFEYSYRFDKGSHTVQNLKLEWYDKNDDSKNLLYTDDFTCTLVLTSAKPAEKNRISVSGTGATISDGSVAFDAVPAEETTITVSRPNDYASYYAVSTDGAEDTAGNSTAETPASITVSGLSAETPQKYTIKWYSDEGEDKLLVGTDTLTVSVRPEDYYSFAAYDTPVVIEEPGTGDREITPNGGNSVELNYNLTEEQWEEVFHRYGEDNRIFLPLWFYLPGSAVKYYKSEYFGNESRPVDEDLQMLRDAQYFGFKLNDGEGDYDGYKSFHEGLVIAQVKYEGNNVIIEPQSGKVSWLIKWLDDKNVDHFHRVTFDVNVSFSGQGIKLTNASPANDRVKFDGREGAKGSYSDGTVRYMLVHTADGFQYGSDGRGKTTTRLVRPSDNAVSATVNGKNVNISETDNAIQLTVDARNDQSMTEAFTVCWLDEYGNTIKTERITISNCPTGAETPWQKYWAPIDRDSINVQDQDLISFFSYDKDNGKLLFKVDENNAGALNVNKMDELSKNELICEITPPAGAKYFKMSGQHSPLYDSYFADSTKEWLEKQPFVDYKLENGKLKPYYCFFDELFNRTKVEGVYVYTVNNTEVTFADIVIFQWYDENKEIIKGEYFYLIKEPYVKISKTKTLTENPTKAVAEPTIVISNSATGKVVTNGVLKTEMPLQNAVDPNSDTRYLYMKLTYIDESTGLEVEPGTEGAVVYLAYPDGMTYEQAQGYTFKLYHYTDENHVTHEEMKLEATPYGLRFKTTSFSPFLLEWTPAASSPSHNESGGLSGVNITNLTNREISSYRLGGGLLSFRLGGSGAVTVTADGRVVTPDADGWYTVPANARIVVDYPVMALPKTGDMPVWRWLPGL